METINILSEQIRTTSVEISRTSKGEFSFCVKSYGKTGDEALAETQRIVALLEIDYPNPKGATNA